MLTDTVVVIVTRTVIISVNGIQLGETGRDGNMIISIVIDFDLFNGKNVIDMRGREVIFFLLLFTDLSVVVCRVRIKLLLLFQLRSQGGNFGFLLSNEFFVRPWHYRRNNGCGCCCCSRGRVRILLLLLMMMGWQKTGIGHQGMGWQG